MIKNVLASVAAFGLVFAPIAAQAGTRAADSGVSMDAMARAAASVGTAEGHGENGSTSGVSTVYVLLGFLLAGAGVFFAIDGSSGNKSPGT